MPLDIEPVSSADVPALATIQWAALSNNPLIRTLYPRGATPSLAAFTTISYQRVVRFPSVHLIKAVDHETGEVVAFAKWILFRKDEHRARSTNPDEPYRDEVDEDDGGGWRKSPRYHDSTSQDPPDCYTKALRDWNGIITRTRKGFMGNKRHSCALSASPTDPSHSLSCYFSCFARSLWVLDILHTHPNHQGRGAGVQLVKWGTDMADSEGIPCYVEASPAALSLLTFCAFDDITEMSMDLGRYRVGMGEYKHIIMLRPPYGIRQVAGAPLIPPKSANRRSGIVDMDIPQIPNMNLMDQDPAWVDTISEATGETSSISSESTASSHRRDGRLKPPRLEFSMGEARLLDLRSSSSTETPRLGIVRDMRSASLRDVRRSDETSTPVKDRDIRASSSMREMRTSATAGSLGLS